MHAPKTFSFFSTAISSFRFISKTRATMSGRSWGFWPGSSASVISFQLGLHVKVMKNVG